MHEGSRGDEDSRAMAKFNDKLCIPDNEVATLLRIKVPPKLELSTSQRGGSMSPGVENSVPAVKQRTCGPKFTEAQANMLEAKFSFPRSPVLTKLRIAAIIGI